MSETSEDNRSLPEVMGTTKTDRKFYGAEKRDKNGRGPVETSSQFEKLFGFRMSDISNMDSIIHLLCQPTDPSGLGVMRIIFGCLMVIDIWQERGLSLLVEEYGDPNQCRFPLFNWLQPLPLVWMYIVYLVLFIGEVGILLGLFYRVSCILFIVTYWYLFFLDKTVWNNHSYLFGLIGILLLLTDTNRYWSLDGLFFKKKRHAHVPLWNYAIFRFQIFIVYFIAGLKKLDIDWVSGYSMHSIAGHFVFAPFRLLLREDQVSLFIVHLGGLTIDLTIGFCLFFDKTRPFAFFFAGSFHIMNSQLFSIGMFPWMMLATMPLFCYPDWPRAWIGKLPRFLSLVLPADIDTQTSHHCVYDKKQVKPDEKSHKASKSQSSTPPPTKPSRYHRFMAGVVITYVTVQCSLPYSHSITKGYNHWTQGLYGYSWDMMVHSWRLQHIKVTYIDKETRQDGYLNPQAWTNNGRWSSHPDMIKQYSQCVKEKLDVYNITGIELHLDIWRALNDRFQQRTVDPRVDILEAPWSPFRDTPWLLPLLVDLSDWREKLAEIERDIFQQDTYTDVVFIADFPGLYLENFVQEDLGNTSITVLKGHVMIELVDQGKNFSLIEGDKMQLPAQQFHNVHTVSETPSCYMYVYVNTTDVQYQDTITLYEQVLNGTFPESAQEAAKIKAQVETGPNRHLYQQILTERERSKEKHDMSYMQQWNRFWRMKIQMLKRSVKFTLGAVRSLVTGDSFETFLNDSYNEEINQNGKQFEQYNLS